MEQSIKRKAVSGVFWKLLEAGGTQGMRLVISIVLARLIDPENYTVLTLMTVFVFFGETIVQKGFSLSLVQRREAGQRDFSSALFASLGIAAVLYAILYFGAPAIASYYNYPQVTDAMRVLSLRLFLTAVIAVQNAILTRKMAFRKSFFAAFIAAVISGIVGIGMAYMGFAIWALVMQQVVSLTLQCIFLFVTDRWRPSPVFDFGRIKVLFRYGWKILASSLLTALYDDLSSLIIGKRYPGETLAFYFKGKQFPSIVGTSLADATVNALFPAYVQEQDDRMRMLDLARKTIRASAYLFFPVMAGIAAVSETLVPVILTDKWIASAPYLRIACIKFALYPIENVSMQIINAVGRSDLSLKLEVIKKVFGTAVICAAAFLFTTPMAIAWAVVVTAVFSFAVVAFVMSRDYGYALRDQILDMLAPVLLCTGLVAAVLLAAQIVLPRLLSLAVQILAGVAAYAALSLIFRPQGYRYLRDSLLEFRKKNRMAKEGNA